MTDYHVDPRPDLTDDHTFWAFLLKRTTDEWWLGMLHGYRCAGMRFELSAKGKLVLRPTIDPVRGFESQEAYEEFRQQWMVPYEPAIRTMLKDLQEKLLGKVVS